MGLYRQSILSFCMLFISSCGVEQIELGAASTAPAEKMIINGEQCLAGEFDSTVELFIDVEIDFALFGNRRITSYLCGGTLIAPDVVLTAAHCLDPNELTMGMGTIKKIDYYIIWEHDLSYISSSEGPMIPTNSVLASSWVIEEEYDSQKVEGPGPGNFHDIGLVFLSKPLDLKPAVVITKEESSQIVNGSEVTIAGWGQRTPNEIDSDDPEQALLTGQKYCAKSLINETGELEMQIGSDEMSSRKCFGDSGGPTYMNVMTENGAQSRVIGITSHAYDDAVCLKGGIDTRVDAWLSWIDGKMREGCTSGSRVWCEVEGIIPPDYNPALAQSQSSLQSWIDYISGWFR